MAAQGHRRWPRLPHEAAHRVLIFNDDAIGHDLRIQVDILSRKNGSTGYVFSIQHFEPMGRGL